MKALRVLFVMLLLAFGLTTESRAYEDLVDWQPIDQADLDKLVDAFESPVLPAPEWYSFLDQATGRWKEDVK